MSGNLLLLLLAALANLSLTFPVSARISTEVQA